MHIYAYNNRSSSARDLAGEMGLKLVRHGEEELRPLNTDLLINWGASWFNRKINYDQLLNSPEAVGKAVNKLIALTTMRDRGIQTVPFTTVKAEAKRWLKQSNVYCRHELRGHSGDGIEVALRGQQDDLPDAPLYTYGIEAKNEFRVHVFKGDAFFVQQKKKRRGAIVNTLVKNYDNGYVYAHQDLEIPDRLKGTAIKAVEALGLDFGAVDIVCYGVMKIPYVLEVNTACGLQGQTLLEYRAQFRKFYAENFENDF